MKKTTAFLFLMFCFSLIKAQDTIIKINGDTIIAKISEITDTQIKYKRFDFQDGPVYIEIKSKVSMIKYANGIKETFKQEPIAAKETTPTTTDDYYGGREIKSNKIESWGSKYRYQGRYIKEREMQSVLIDSKNKQVISLIGKAKDAKNLQYIGFAGIPMGVLSIGYLWKSTGIFNYNYNYTGGKAFNQQDLAISALCGIVAIACPVISIVSKGNRNKYNRQAIKIYNEKF